MPPGAVDAHLAACPACATWYEAAARVTRLIRLSPAAPVPDLTARVLAAAGPLSPPRHRALRVLRVALALLGLVQLGLAVPAVVLGLDGLHPPMHVAHESGAWNVALAAAFLAAAARPRYAAGLLPLLGVYVVVLAGVSLQDIAMGDVTVPRLAEHVPVVAALLLVAAVNRSAGRPRVPPRRDRSTGDGGPVTAEGDAAAGDWPSGWDGQVDPPAAAEGRASQGAVAGGTVADGTVARGHVA
jgi:predicted anti-sigma-YlaC factor YlaD